MCIYIYICMYTYIYIYIEREREIGWMSGSWTRQEMYGYMCESIYVTSGSSFEGGRRFPKRGPQGIELDLQKSREANLGALQASLT